MSRMNVRQIANNEPFARLELTPHVQNEVTSWLHRFCRADGDTNSIILHTYEGQEIKIPISKEVLEQYTDPETGKPYQSVVALTQDITAALYGSLRVLISRATEQARHRDNDVSGWFPDPETGDPRFGYRYLNWESDKEEPQPGTEYLDRYHNED